MQVLIGLAAQQLCAWPPGYRLPCELIGAVRGAGHPLPQLLPGAAVVPQVGLLMRRHLHRPGDHPTRTADVVVTGGEGVCAESGVKGRGAPVFSSISGSDEICVGWSASGTFMGGGCAGYRSYVWCLAVVRMKDGRRRRFSSSIASDEDDGIGIW
jgi:hypothetical protein